MMIPRNIGLATGLAAAAQAFILPSTITLPGVSVNDNDGIEGDYKALADPLRTLRTSFTLYVPCLDCNFRPVEYETSDFGESDHEDKNQVKLVFSVSREDSSVLELNGNPFYPFMTRRHSLTTTLVLDRHHTDIESEPRKIFYSASAGKTSPGDGSNAKLIHVGLTITGLDEDEVDVGRVEIKMLSDEQGRLNILGVGPPSEQGLPPNPFIPAKEVEATPPMTECPAGRGPSTILCQLRNAVAQKIEDWKLVQPNAKPHERRPCPGATAFHKSKGLDVLRAPYIRGGPSKFKHHPHEHWHSDHHHHHHHHHHQASRFIHAFASGLRSFVLGFLVPVLIGLAAGMTASLVGMVLGSLIAWLWIKLVRGGKRGNATEGQRAREAMADDEVYIGEKDGLLLDHTPALEGGEALPVYVEKE